jgi:hypothetical protein
MDFIPVFFIVSQFLSYDTIRRKKTQEPMVPAQQFRIQKDLPKIRDGTRNTEDLYRASG